VNDFQNRGSDERVKLININAGYVMWTGLSSICGFQHHNRKLSRKAEHSSGTKLRFRGSVWMLCAVRFWKRCQVSYWLMSVTACVLHGLQLARF